MGAIWVTRAQLQGAVSELAGLRSGLALTANDIERKVAADKDSALYWMGDLDDTIRIRSEEYEGLFCALLAALGAVPHDAWLPPGMYLARAFRGDGAKARLAMDILNLLIGLKPINPAELDDDDPFSPAELIQADALRSSRALAELIATRRRRPGGDFLRSVETKFGPDALELAKFVQERVRLYFLVTPWTAYVERQWSDTLPLSDLFKSEGLKPTHGKFLDQRFVDYLTANFEDVGHIHWRKFEALAAEHFHREGCEVEVGPGRNDDGIDLRVWEKAEGPGRGPLILVQCKRQKEAVGKVVVKSLCLDVAHEGAAKGVIVTTGRVSAGVRKHWSVRQYGMEFIEREQVREWLVGMRTPGTGPFQAE